MLLRIHLFKLLLGLKFDKFALDPVVKHCLLVDVLIIIIITFMDLHIGIDRALSVQNPFL